MEFKCLTSFDLERTLSSKQAATTTTTTKKPNKMPNDSNRQPLSPKFLNRASLSSQALIKSDEDQQFTLQAKLYPALSPAPSLSPSPPQKKNGYKRITLIKETYKHCKNQGAFLEYFFTTFAFLLLLLLQAEDADFTRGLSTVEGFLTEEGTSDDVARALFDYADKLLVFYWKSRSNYNTNTETQIQMELSDI